MRPNILLISEFYREPDAHIGYLFDLFSMGTILSLLMILAGLFVKKMSMKENEN